MHKCIHICMFVCVFISVVTVAAAAKALWWCYLTFVYVNLYMNMLIYVCWSKHIFFVAARLGCWLSLALSFSSTFNWVFISLLFLMYFRLIFVVVFCLFLFLFRLMCTLLVHWSLGISCNTLSSGPDVYFWPYVDLRRLTCHQMYAQHRIPLWCVAGTYSVAVEWVLARLFFISLINIFYQKTFLQSCVIKCIFIFLSRKVIRNVYKMH